MIPNIRSCLHLLCAAFFGLAVAGCDIAPDIRIGGEAPSTGGNANELDPDLPANIAGYFYAGRPVEGLVYQCVTDNRPPLSGNTDRNGFFVCPRSWTASFFLGVPGEKTRKLGEIDLSIFGSEISAEQATARNHVLITPASLLLPSPVSPFGVTATDSDNSQVTNTFNLLVSLDTVIDRTDRFQDSIVITEETHQALAEESDFSSLDFTTSSATFAIKLQELVEAIAPSVPAGLVLKTSRPAYPVLSAAEAEALTDESLLRARSGLYRTNSMSYATSGTTSSGLFLTTSFIVGNNGRANGFSQVLEASGSSSVITSATSLTVYLMQDTARVAADGLLSGFTFLEYLADGSDGTKTLGFAGSFINDAIYGDERLCGASPNELVPVPYCEATASRDGYSASDEGLFYSPVSAPDYEGSMYIARVAESLPDIDLDLLPQDYLPRTFEVSLARYPDIQKSEFQNQDLAAVAADKTAFGTPAAIGTMRYTVMPNGDIVSDSDGDCEDLSLVDGEYVDDGTTTEYLIGRVGNVFEGNGGAADDYLTVQFAALDPRDTAHHGLTFGYAAVYRSLFPIVLRVADSALLSKNECVLNATCNYKIEWFNDIRYLLDVAIPDFDNAGDTGEAAVDDALHKDGTYYGQVTGNVEVTGATAICRP